MKGVFVILLIGFVSVVAAQKRRFIAPLNIAEYTSPQIISKKITASASTDYEKVAAIFHWITDNIAYNTGVLYPVPHKAPVRFAVPELHDTAALPPLNHRVAESVLSRRVAVCDGYARLFASLSFYAGVKAEVVTGYVRDGGGRSGERFRSNHTWNAVQIDSTWHLLDVTWASGYVTFGNQFVPHYNPQYFLTPPQSFIRDHYPENLQWTLLNNPPALKEFEEAPFKYQAFLKYKIDSFSPATGIIEAAEGDTVQVQIESGWREKKLFVTTGAITDSLLNVLENEPADSIVAASKEGIFRLTVKENEGNWVTVLFNNEPVLGYQLKIRKKDATAFLRND